MFRLRSIIDVPPAGLKLLLHLLDHPGRVVSGDALLQVVAKGDPEDLSIRLVDVRICLLRKAMRKAGIEGAILTHWGLGYSMDPAWAGQISEMAGLVQAVAA